MRIPLRATLLVCTAVCSIGIFCTSFISTYLLGVEGVERLARTLQFTQRLHLQAAIATYAHSVQLENTQFAKKQATDLINVENYDHEFLKKWLCTTLEASPNVVYSAIGTEKDGIFVGCMKEVNQTTGKISEYQLNIRNSSNMAERLDLVLNPEDNWSENAPHRTIPGFDPRTRMWYQATLGSQAWTNPYLWSDGYTVGITAGVPLYNSTTVKDNTTVIGVYASDINIITLSTFLASLEMGTTGRAMIINAPTQEIIGVSWDEPLFNKEADVLGGSGSSNFVIKLKKPEDIVDPFMSRVVQTFGPTSNAFMAKAAGTYEEDEQWVAFDDVTDQFGLQWRLVIAMDEREFLGDLRVQRTLSLVIVPVMILMLIIGQAFLGSAVVNSLMALRNRMVDLELDIGDMNRGNASLSENMAIRSPKAGSGRQRRLPDPSDPLAHSTSDKTSFVAEVANAEDAFEHMETAIKSFTRFVPREVVCTLLADGELADLGMGPAFCSILFCDLQNFTKMSDAVDTSSLVWIMEVYFDTMTDLVHNHGGSVDKYIGDCVMAVWGAPFKVDHAEIRCVSCAVSMKRAAGLEGMQELFEPTQEKCEVRIGAHHGNVLAGCMGGAQRLSYTVVGASVNLAARLEPLNKRFGTQILISEDLNQVVREIFVTRLCHFVRVKGFETATKVYEVRGVRPGFVADETASIMKTDVLTEANLISVGSNLSSVVPVPGEEEEEEGNPLAVMELRSITERHTSQDQGGSSKGSSAGSLRRHLGELRLPERDILDLLRHTRDALLISTLDEVHYCERFSAAVHLYIAGEFQKCHDLILSCEKRYPASEGTILHVWYKDRCLELMQASGKPNNSTDDWNGVMVLDHK